MKQVPERTCICCREKKYKGLLLRMAVHEGGLVFDRAQKKPGRGYYLCRDPKCIDRCLNEKHLKKVIKRGFSELAELKESMKREVGC
ncbi:MAG: YlxR family protein [Nitrospirae bacterium]|nr:YlxR family protein [Nitrospirota bacterium]